MSKNHVLDGVNWELLSNQKLTLIKLVNVLHGKEREHLEGLVSLLDYFQDYMVDNKLKTHKEIFGHDVH